MQLKTNYSRQTIKETVRKLILSDLGLSDGVYFLKYKVIGSDGTEVSGHTFFHLIR